MKTLSLATIAASLALASAAMGAARPDPRRGPGSPFRLRRAAGSRALAP